MRAVSVLSYEKDMVAPWGVYLRAHAGFCPADRPIDRPNTSIRYFCGNDNKGRYGTLNAFHSWGCRGCRVSGGGEMKRVHLVAMLVNEFNQGWRRDDADLVTLVEQLSDGFASSRAVIEGPIVYVHADESVR
jgi:hypothetical protein